jgi:hypothetical protein
VILGRALALAGTAAILLPFVITLNRAVRIGGALALLAGLYLANPPRRSGRDTPADDPPAYEPSDPVGWAADISRSAANRRF